MSTLPSQSALFQNLLVLLLVFSGLTSKSLVLCARSSSSSLGSTTSTSSASSESSSGTGSPSGTQKKERELISAQRRAVQEARDLDTSEAGNGGVFDPLSAAAGLAEEEALMSKYMAASASAYTPSKLRLNPYSQTGLYDPYSAYTSTFNNVPSSYYPYNTYAAAAASFRENPILDNYPFYERDRLREVHPRAMQAISPTSFSGSNTSAGMSSSSSSNRDGMDSSSQTGFSGGGGFREGFRSNDHDSTAMSSGHGHDEHGNGWGHSHPILSKINTNAIGLLGLLGLLSLLSNVLFLLTKIRTTTASGRRKRDASITSDIADEETHEQKRERIFMEILPHLTPVAHARDGVLPLECTLRGVCMTNRLLVDELGILGRVAGVRMSSAIVKLLDKVTPSSYASSKSHKGKPELKKKLESAALRGRNEKDCDKIYPVCGALQMQAAPSLPFTIRMQDLPQLISKVSKLSKVGVPKNL